MKKRLITLALLPVLAQAQQYFTSPDMAVSALVHAVSTQNAPALNKLLGEDWRRIIPEKTDDPEAIARFLRDWNVSHHIIVDEEVAYLNMGDEDWQLPLPVRKSDKGWYFDTVKAAVEIRTREIGRSELDTIQSMHAFVDAQRAYYQMNHVWARKLISSPGKKDGLYWPVKPGETPSPLGPYYSPVDSDMGYHGYRFRIIADNDPSGVALIAWPVDWGQTGVMSFCVDLHDRIYQTNFGKQTSTQVAAVMTFSPGAPWQEISVQR